MKMKNNTHQATIYVVVSHVAPYRGVVDSIHGTEADARAAAHDSDIVVERDADTLCVGEHIALRHSERHSE